MSDLPLEEGSGNSDVPLEISLGDFGKQRPEELDSMYRGHAAVLKSEIAEMPLHEAYSSMPISPDSKAELSSLAYQRSQIEQRALKDYFNANLGGTPEEAAENIEVFKSLQEEEEAAAEVPEKQIVAAMAGVEAQPEEVTAVEAQMKLVNSIDDIVQDYTFWEKVKGVGKGFLPGAALLDNLQVAPGFNPFEANDYLRDVVVGMKDLRRNNPEKFAEILPAYIQELEENLPKNKQLGALLAILDPAGEEEGLDDFSDFAAGLDVVDVATLGAAAALSSIKTVSKLNAIKTLSRLENVEDASNINTAAIIDDTGEVAKNAGVSSDTIYGNGSPFNIDGLDEAYAKGISSSTLQRINTVKEQQRKISEMIRSEDGLLREDLLTPTERLAAEDKFVADMKTEGIEDVTVVTRGQDATTFSYKKVDPDTNETTLEQATMNLEVSDITGTWQHTEENMTAAWIKSPTVFAKNAPDAVKSAIRMDSTSAVAGEALQTMQREALSPILGAKGLRGLRPKARRELMELDEVLRAGDEYTDASGVVGKVYSTDELRGGVVNGRPLNDRQIETYYNLRGLYDELWVIRNNETRRTLTAQGKREVSVDGSPQIGKPLDLQGAVGVVNRQGTVRVYDSASKEVKDLTRGDLSELYDNGLSLSRLDSPIAPEGVPDELFDLVLTKSDNVSDLPDKVLHFREGYVPKINKNANWFVKESSPTTINGAQNIQRKTVRMFASRTEADRWMQSQGSPSNWELLPDRAIEQQVLNTPELGAGGGLYTGPRASKPVPFGPEGDAPERLNTFEALNTNIQSLENYISRNQWRMSMQQRWINSAKAAGFKDIDRFEKALIPEGDERGKGLRKLAEQIEIWSGFPTHGEMAWDGFVSGVMEWALKGTRNKRASDTIVRGANYLRERGNDPVTLARNTAFHSLLGVFNPAQLWVQAQGMSLAASLSNSPLRAFRMQTALAIASKFPDGSKAFNTVAKAGLVDPGELQKLTKLWNKTGLESSTLNTADHAAAAVGVGTTRAALRRVFDKGLLLYRAGELFNRRYSFLVATERYQRRTGKTIDGIGDADLKEILTDANNMMLNLSKANRAAWQRGVVSVPTQFLQVQAKFLETMVGANKDFSAAERMRILAGQMALYGAAGIPLGSLGVRWAQESLGFSQKDLEEAPPEVITAINEGFWGVYAKQFLGADVDLSSRGAISAGMTEFTLDLMFSEASMGEKILGAFGMVPHRSFQAWKTIKPMLMSDTDIPMTRAEYMKGLNALASITSTWNNARKAAFMHRFHQLNDTRGNRVVEDYDFAIETEIMTMLGFQPSEQGRVADRELLVRSRKEYRSQITNDLMNHYWNYVQIMANSEDGPEKDKLIERYRAGTLVLLKSLRNEGERDAVRAAMQNRILNGEDRRSKSIREFIETFADGQVLAKGSFVEAATASGIITNDLEFPEDE